MFTLEVLESLLALVGVVMLRFVLFLAVVFAMAIPIAIVVKSYEGVMRLVRRVPAAATAGGHGAAKVPR
jgi:hypothetical protein